MTCDLRWAVILLLISGRGPLAQGLRAEQIGSIAPNGPTAAYRIADLDADGRAELLIVCRDGTVRTHGLSDGALSRRTSGAELVLPDPEHSLLALADVVGDQRTELVVLSRRGVAAYALDADGGFTGEPLSLTASGRLGIRTAEPRFADFVDDINRDGHADLIVPVGRTCELWLRSATNGSSAPRYDLAQTLPIAIELERRVRGRRLSASLQNRVSIPHLDTADCNGDGRPDLRVRDGLARRFYLQAADGRFAERPITVDLSMFRDTTPKADVELGTTVVIGDDAQMQDGDLNADGIPDYVVAHRRKVWTFLSSAAGPQFTKSRTRRVAEDISGLVLMHLDDDDRDDLLVFKIELPSAADLVLGFVASIDIPVTALGYAAGSDGSFERSARWRRTLTLRMPSLISLLSEAENLVEEFREIVARLRWSALGDFDGDGTRDLVLLREDETAMDLWLQPKESDRPERAIEQWIKELLFDDPQDVFDVDRMLVLAGQVLDARNAALTGDRAADVSTPFEVPPDRFLLDLIAADLVGDGRDELVVVHDRESAPGDARFDVYRWLDG